MSIFNAYMALSGAYDADVTRDERLSHHTTYRIGGPAALFVKVNSYPALLKTIEILGREGVDWVVLGKGSNILAADRGYDGCVIVLGREFSRISFDGSEVTAGAGATIARLVSETLSHSLSGLECLVGIPGTVGGAVYGNAGAHGKDVCQSLLMAEILHRSKGLLSLDCDGMGFTYRSSAFKREPGNAVILSATFNLAQSTRDAVQAKVDAINEKRRNAQPAGASLGSTFKNPAGDHAGRLIEAAGLKGTRVGGVEISPVHGNFLINDGSGCAEDYRQLIALVQKTVREQFAVELQLEIELFGDWKK